MLDIKNLTKSYGKHLVLKGLDLTVKPGEVYGLLGPNGAGKTTTINILCNLLQADSGIVKINGQILSAKTKSLLGVAPQENLLYKHLTCEENLNFYGQLYGLKKNQRRQQIERTLTAVNLINRRTSIVDNLSGGMQRRLNIAVALIHQPKILILDEPTTGLDIEARYEIWEFIQQLKYQGITTLLTTHLLDEAEHLCQRIGILKEGKIIVEGSLKELRKLIAAQEIILVTTEDEQQVILRGKALGLTQRRYGGELAFWLSESLNLKEIINYFEGMTLDSINRQPVRLEHIYLEVTQSTMSNDQCEFRV